MTRARIGSALAAIILLLLAAAPPRARAALLAYEGTLEMHWVQVGFFTPPTLTGAGVATVGGTGNHLDSMAIGSNVFTGSVFTPVTDPAAAPGFLGLKLTVSSHAGATFAGPPGSTSGTFGGTISVNGTRGVGLGGGSYAVGEAPLTVALTVAGAAWTIGLVTAQRETGTGIVTESAQGFAHGPASGGLSSAAQAGGIVSLVTPIQINTAISGYGDLPVFGELTLHFVPEPGMLLLFGTAGALLALLGGSRRSE
jgi:hypothetical protein